MEGLAYLAKSKPLLAAGAFAKVAQSDTIWKIAAMHYMSHKDAESFEIGGELVTAPAQVVEACFPHWRNVLPLRQSRA